MLTQEKECPLVCNREVCDGVLVSVMKKLLIFAVLALVPVFALARPSTHIVVAGDTLSSIAYKYGISLRTLINYNPQLIKPGNVLNLVSNPTTSVPIPTPTPIPVPVSIPIPTPVPQPTSNEVFIKAYTTAYTYWDNTPPGSADISHPILHSKAGGTGTYANPITLAVGHSIISGKDILDYPAGTKFYIPNVRRYFIVEDTCGDGGSPQNGPCHTGYPLGTTTWVDMWIDGQSGSSSAANSCAENLTDGNGVAHTIIKNPASNYVVVSGPVFQNGSCSAQYGNTAVKI